MTQADATSIAFTFNVPANASSGNSKSSSKNIAGGGGSSSSSGGAPLPIKEQVDVWIKEATSPERLAVMFEGWAAYV